MRNELQSLWSFLAVAIYAGGYACTAPIIKTALAPYKATTEPLNEYIMYATLAGVLVTGIVGDKISARAAVNLSMLSSAAIYACIFLILEAKTASAVLPQVAVAARVLTTLQHAMQAITAYACIRHGNNSGFVALSSIISVAIGYVVGNVAATQYAGLIGNKLQIVIAVGFAHVGAVVLSWLFRAPQVAVVGRRPDGSLRAVAAPGLKRSFFSVLITFAPHLIFVFAVRSLRLFVDQSKTHLHPGDKPFWETLAPLTADNVFTVAAYLFVIPPLMLFTRGPGSVLGVCIIAMVAARGAMAWDPAVMDDARQSQFFFAIFSVANRALYILPTAVIGIAATPGTKSRVLAIQAVVSTVITYSKSAQVKALLMQAATSVAPAIVPGRMFATHELEAIAFFGCALVSLLMLPGVAYAAPVLGEAFKATASKPSSPAPSASAAAAQSTKAAAAAAAPASKKPVLKKK